MKNQFNFLMWETEFLVKLGKFAASTAKAIPFQSEQAYSVLGAEGDSFFIEVASGFDISKRVILKTIHIDFDGNNQYLTASDDDEISISLPSGTYMIALLALLAKALRTECVRVLHPLNECGNYLRNWESALTEASTELSS